MLLAAGGAALTIVLVLAVVAGPSVRRCFDSPDFGACLRAGMVDAGIALGLPRIVAVPLPPEEAQPASAPPVQVADVPAPYLASEPPPVAARSPEASPTIGPAPSVQSPALVTLLRVEPDGRLVVAGMAPPGATVEVWVNDRLLGTTTTDKGDWAFVPDTPLGAGGAELVARIAGSDAPPAQSFAIIVDEAGRNEPLVVVSRPGEASGVLQGVARPTVAAPASPPAAPKVAQPQQPGQVADVPPVAAVEPEATAPAASAGLLSPTIDAIEIDGSRDFFAGAGADGAVIRLYVEDDYIADALVSGGRWLVEASNALVKRTQRIRIDMLQPGSSTVLARAEVNFVVDLPVEPVPPQLAAEPAPRTAVGLGAQVPVSAPAAPTVVATEPGAASTMTAPSAEVAIGSAEAVAAQGAPPADMASIAPATPAQPSGEAVAVAVPEAAPPGEAAGQDQPAQAAAPPPAAIVAAGELPEVPRRTVTTPATGSVLDLPPPTGGPPLPELVAEQTPAPTLPAPSGEAVQDLAPSAQIPTMLAVPTGEQAEGVRFAAGKIIIRRGDNLWAIARRAYGDGLKYTMIFDANEDQIRNPDRIYPGQVFSLPGAPATGQ